MIKEARYLVSNQDFRLCPDPDMPEYAMIGRSNVGKSSLINMLTRQKGLAKTSQQPGKTQLINHFVIDGEWYLVDLPGYGYAKVSKGEREKWGVMLHDYLKHRPNLVSLFVLIDSRIPAQKSDLEFMAMLGEEGIPFYMVFTKSDKLKKSQLEGNLRQYQEILRGYWEELPPYVVTSSETGAGREELLNIIALNNQTFVKGKQD